MTSGQNNGKQISGPIREALERLRKDSKTRALTADEQKFMIEAVGESIAGLARQFKCWDNDIARVISRTPGRALPAVRKRLARFLGVPVSAIGREAARKLKKKAA